MSYIQKLGGPRSMSLYGWIATLTQFKTHEQEKNKRPAVASPMHM